jgi:dTMP kinase
VAGRGRLVALEGIDGCGKSTQARLLAERLGAVLTAEPGATALGAALRRLLLDPDLPPLSARAEALLMAADRAEHVDEVVEPALAAGRWVVTDRYSGSTIAYQGHGRELDLDGLRRLVTWAAAGLAADLVVVLDVPLALARDRLGRARPDRLEGLDEGFHARVREGFLAQAAADPERWVVVDASGTVDDVSGAVGDAVASRLGAP